MEELKKKWGKGSFKNTENSIEYHFNEHGEEVGASDLRQYLRKAEVIDSLEKLIDLCNSAEKEKKEIKCTKITIKLGNIK